MSEFSKRRFERRVDSWCNAWDRIIMRALFSVYVTFDVYRIARMLIGSPH